MSLEEVQTAESTVDETGCTRQATKQLLLPHLFLVLEGARPQAGGARHDLWRVDEVLIGRGVARSASRALVGGSRVVTLAVPDARMSRKHARISRRDTRYVLEDLGSRNGSRVGGTLVRDPVELNDGDLLEFGRTFWRFRAALPTPPDAHPDVDSDGPPKAPQGWATLLPALAERHAAVAKVALSIVPVLLHGETGTGKEVLARAIHQASGRRGRFVAVNCGAIPPTLVEAQLFGHVRGAFSGATQNEPGFVRSADGGTLFLDEIGDLPRGAQAALLRVLQEREVVPVGSAAAQRVDMRVICATHSDLREGVTRGLFRADLLSRLDGLTHTLPPLRERMEDLGLLIAALLSRIEREQPAKLAFTLRAVRALLAHDWPLNVRELEQRLSVAAVLATTGTIDVEHLPAGASGVPLKALEETPDEGDEALREHLVVELDRAGGNVAAVARSMGKARMQVQRWMKRFKIDASAFRVHRA